MNGTEQVDAYMGALDHPFKAEMAALRAIIMGANDKVAERIKWKVPSFFYRADIAAFHPRAKGFVQVIFVFPNGLVDDRTGLLEGDWKDRRMARFYDLADVQAKQAALEHVINAWVRLEEDAR